MISSTSNQHIRFLKQILGKAKERNKNSCFVAEGSRMVSEIPPDMILELYVSESFARAHSTDGAFRADLSRSHAGDSVYPADISGAQVIDDRVFRSVSDTQNPQGIMAVVKQYSYNIEEILAGEHPLVLFLENIQDPGNLGTIIRTAEGAGVSGVVMSGDTVDIYNPKTVRSTMGSLCRVPFVYTEDICEAVSLARDSGITVYAAYLEGSSVYTERDYTAPSAFMIGNEGNGLSERAVKSADRTVRIPMYGKLESLNASVSAAVLLYEAVRQRRSQVCPR